MRFNKILITSFVATSLVAGVVQAQDRSASARQSQMKLLAFNMGQLGSMAKGSLAYDATAAEAAATNILMLSKLDSAAMWPEGTDDMSIDGTRAMPSIWENMADFQAKSSALTTAAEGMAAAAGNGLDALKAAMGPLGGSCGACHKAHRTPKN